MLNRSDVRSRRLCAFVIRLAWLALLPACTSGTVSTDYALSDINGLEHRPLAQTGSQPVVVIFIAADCPICNSYAPVINELVQLHGRSAKFYLVHVEHDLTTAQAQEHTRAYSFRCPVLMDQNHELVRALGATITPEAVVVSSGGGVAYRGRIDDRYVELGKSRLEPSQNDLRDAIEALTNGKPVPHSRTKAVGCLIADFGKS